jgi:hypothetical protein
MPEQHQESADVLSQHGNLAVVQLPHRRFPALAIQGDTLSIVVAQARAAREGISGNAITSNAADELHDLLAKLGQMLQVYEYAVSRAGLPLPYAK